MSRTKRFLYNSIFTAMLQIVVMITGIITPRIMLDAYGSEINGLISSILQFISYFNLVEAGLASAAIYALYKPLAEDNHNKINGVVSAANKFYLQSGYIFISLTIILAVIYPTYIKTLSLDATEVFLLTLILGVNGALEFFTLAKYRVLLTADQKTYIISTASTIQVIVNTIIIVILAKLNVNIIILRLVALLSIFIRSLILMIYCKINYPYVDYSVQPNKKALNKRWDALYLQLLGVITTGTPVVIITLMLKDLKLVSVYTIFNMVVVGLSGILSIFISGLSASFGEVLAKGEMRVLQQSYKEFEFAYYTLITIVYSVAFVTIMPFIRVYTNGIQDVNYNMPVLGFLFVLNALLNNIKTPQGMLVISAGMYKETRWQTTIQAAIAIVIGIVLSLTIGIYGVVIASILANLYRDIDLVFFIPKNVTKLPYNETIKRILRIFICIIIICMPVIVLNIEINSLMMWILYALLVGVYAIIVVGIISVIFDRKELNNLINRLKKMKIIKRERY